jgi:hypothetical protein
MNLLLLIVLDTKNSVVEGGVYQLRAHRKTLCTLDNSVKSAALRTRHFS